MFDQDSYSCIYLEGNLTGVLLYLQNISKMYLTTTVNNNTFNFQVGYSLIFSEELHLHPSSFLCHMLLHIKTVCQMGVDLNRVSLLLRVVLLLLKLCLSFRKHTIIKCQYKLLTWQLLKHFIAMKP